MTRPARLEGKIQGRRDFAQGIERDVSNMPWEYQAGYTQGLKDGSFHAHERATAEDRERRREAGLD